MEGPLSVASSCLSRYCHVFLCAIAIWTLRIMPLHIIKCTKAISKVKKKKLKKISLKSAAIISSYLLVSGLVFSFFLENGAKIANTDYCDHCCLPEKHDEQLSNYSCTLDHSKFNIRHLPFFT